MLILTLLRQLSDWCRPIETCQLTSSETVTKRWWCVKWFCCSLFSLLLQLHTVSYSAGCWVNIFSSVNYIMLTSLDEYYWPQFLVAESCTAVWVFCGRLFMQFLCIAISWRHISQDRVATNLRCGGIFNYHFTANLSLSLTVKEFLKSVKVWQSYRH